MLFILRHGLAEPFRHDDATRALVPRGIAQVQACAAWFNQNGYVVNACFASPFLRTQQTAHAFLQHCGSTAAIQSEPLLLSETDPVLSAAWINAVHPVATLLVSHMPLVSLLCEQLGGRRIDFSTASLAVFKRQPSQWQLVNFYHSEQL